MPEKKLYHVVWLYSASIGRTKEKREKFSTFAEAKKKAEEVALDKYSQSSSIIVYEPDGKTVKQVVTIREYRPY